MELAPILQRPVRGCLALALFLVLPSYAVSTEDGSRLYKVHCASCHGKDGRAKTPIGRKLGVKDLSQSKLKDTEIRKQITEGVVDPSGKLKMPAFKERLTIEKIEALLPVVKAFRK